MSWQPKIREERRGDAEDGRPVAELPALPTAYPPGTVGKLYVMMQRAERGECLWHPQDSRG